jgi:hypothetical protein
MNTEPKEAMAMKAIIKQPVKTQKTKDLVHAVVNCILCELLIVL